MILIISTLRVRGMALFPFILLQNAHDRHDRQLINHEKIHHRQQIELLVLPFYVWYLAEYGIYRLGGMPHYQAYMNISFEKEAYRHDAEPHYLQKRPLWNFRRYLS
jgi:hypothetical protein